MQTEADNRTRRSWQFHLLHTLAWLLGAAAMSLPYHQAWTVNQIPLRFGPGNFAYNLISLTLFCVLGMIIGGYWMRFTSWLAGASSAGWKIIAGFMAVWAPYIWLCYAEKIPSSGILWLSMFGLVAVSVLAALMGKKSRGSQNLSWPSWTNFKDWLRECRAWNGMFFALLLLALLTNNFFSIWLLQGTATEVASAMLGRCFTQAVLVCIFYVLMELVLRASPIHLRWIVWAFVGLVPFLVIADQLLGMMWGRSLIELLNGLTASGNFDLAVELAAGGIEVSNLTVYLSMLAVVGGAGLLVLAAWLISKKFSMKMSLGRAFVIGFTCWLFVIVEQGVGALWKDVVAWQSEREVFGLGLSLVNPRDGLTEMTPVFIAPQPEAISHQLEKKPDIIILMVESLRADAIDEKTTPFLSQFKQNEAQQLERTWAASNATHLSWFSFFHSQVPVFWRSTLESIEDRETFLGAPMLQALKNSGYHMEVRAVCDLSYKDFGMLNFGTGTQLVDFLRHVDGADEFSSIGIPAREQWCFEEMQSSIAERPAGGGFYFLGLDSPHYNYYWHRDFDPPYKEYDTTVRFPVRPNEQAVQRVRNRYLNAAAWVDHQIEEFTNFLKQEGRYDDSIIIITGDHGEEFQEHGSWFHCSSLQPEQTAVPILIKWPASMGRGPSQLTASHLDVMPSLADALGYPSEWRQLMAGRSLLEENGEVSAVMTTAYAGRSGECMALRRGDLLATFTWARPWEAEVPQQMVLKSLSDQGEPIKLAKPEDYQSALFELFPDVKNRLFSTSR